MQLSSLKCSQTGQHSGLFIVRFAEPHWQQVHTSSTVLVIMVALLKPLMWCSWGGDAGRRPEEELGDELAKAPPASGRESVRRLKAEATAETWHPRHSTCPHTGQCPSVRGMRFAPSHPQQTQTSCGISVISNKLSSYCCGWSGSRVTEFVRTADPKGLAKRFDEARAAGLGLVKDWLGAADEGPEGHA